MNSGSAGVAQQIRQRNFFLGGEIVIGELPGCQLVVDVFIEGDLSLLDLL